jgi:hypothetical protein
MSNEGERMAFAIFVRYTLRHKALGAQDGRRRARPEVIMQKMLRRTRGAIGIGLTWGAAWGVAGMVPRWVLGIETDVPFPIVFAVLGFDAGIVFSGILALTEGRRGFDGMSLPRFTGWGAVGGLLLSAVFAKAASLGWGDVLAVAPVFTLASAVCAAGSLALARRAVRHELPDVRSDLLHGGD